MEDKTDLYSRELEELVIKLRNKCNQLGIPCFMMFGVSQNEENKQINVKSECILPEMLKIDVGADYKFADCVNVLNGFTAVPKVEKDVNSIDADFLSAEIPDNQE